MMRRGVLLRGLSGALTVESESYEAVVVGGGVAGSLIAARLAGANVKTLLVESGPDVLKQPEWHRRMPAAPVAHDAAGRYRRAHATTPQRAFAFPPRSATANASAASEAVISAVPVPDVLGGAGVVGAPRRWIRPTAADFAGLPFPFWDDVLPLIRRFENVDCTGGKAEHRGATGRVFLTRPMTSAPLLSPLLQAAMRVLKTPFIVDFNPPSAVLSAGAGRVDSRVNPMTLASDTTLDPILTEAVAMHKPLTIRTGTRALRVVTDRAGKATAVELAPSVGAAAAAPPATSAVGANLVVLCAGGVGSAQVLSRSAEGLAPAVAAAVGRNFWDAPAAVLRYELSQPGATLCPVASSKVVQLAELWRWRRKRPGFASNGWDDTVLLLQSPGAAGASAATAAEGAVSAGGTAAQPDIVVTCQPFLLPKATTGTATEGGPAVQGGFQLTVSLARPASRGVVTDASVDPAYFSAASDREALAFGIAAARAIAEDAGLARDLRCVVRPAGESLQSFGCCGGSLSAGVVDPATMLVHGTPNLYVSDGSVLGQPMLGDAAIAVTALAELCADKLLRLR